LEVGAQVVGQLSVAMKGLRRKFDALIIKKLIDGMAKGPDRGDLDRPLDLEPLCGLGINRVSFLLKSTLLESLTIAARAHSKFVPP
jgi:hypothetical protein